MQDVRRRSYSFRERSNGKWSLVFNLRLILKFIRAISVTFRLAHKQARPKIRCCNASSEPSRPSQDQSALVHYARWTFSSQRRWSSIAGAFAAIGEVEIFGNASALIRPEWTSVAGANKGGMLVNILFKSGAIR
jgi:hypothetical protein